MGPYRLAGLRGRLVTGYNTTLGSNNLIVENIMMNDDRNDTRHQCVIVLEDALTIQRESNETLLLVAGEYHYRVHYHVYNYTLQCDLMHTYIYIATYVLNKHNEYLLNYLTGQRAS